MKNLRRFLLLIPLLLASCSEKQKLDEPVTPEAAASTELALQDTMPNEVSGEADDSVAEEMKDELSGETPSDTPDSPASYPEVTPVSGKPGFVYSPYNNEIIDVQGLPSGTLVADPYYPPSEKKYFRIP